MIKSLVLVLSFVSLTGCYAEPVSYAEPFQPYWIEGHYEYGVWIAPIYINHAGNFYYANHWHYHGNFEVGARGVYRAEPIHNHYSARPHGSPSHNGGEHHH